MAEAPALLRSLMQWQRLRQLYCSGQSLFYVCLTSSSKTSQVRRQLLCHNSPFCLSYQQRSLNLYTRALKLRDVSLPSKSNSNSNSNSSKSDIDSSSSDDDNVRRSRNEKKRDAKRAVRWGMELAKLSPAQIKLILRVTSLKPEVYDALMLVKKLGPDVREGKRRQFNYIGKLLREVEPVLMDELIQATKDGDTDKLRDLCGSEEEAIEDAKETEDEYEEEELETCISVASKWFDGLIRKDVEVINEIYSLNNVDFDRQELRRLVRKVHVLQEHQVSSEAEEKSQKVNADVFGAQRSLARFLQRLAKQLPVE